MFPQSLPLADVIRINQFVRGRIDVEGFDQWYRSATDEDQIAILYHLHTFAQQAGYDEALFRRAVDSAMLTPAHPLVIQVSTFFGGYSGQMDLTLDEWARTLDEDDRHTLLRLLVYLFGLAEGRVFARERPEYCNHWWHRDLLDARVVADMLNDPAYFNSSMRDDLKFTR